MDLLKGFISHLLAIVLLLAIIFLTGSSISREFLTYDNIYKAMDDANLLEEVINDVALSKGIGVPKEIYDYIKVDDIVYDYVTNYALYDVNIIEERPTIDSKVLNERLARAIEKFIDDNIVKYGDDIDTFLKEQGLDIDFKEVIEDYIIEKKAIDFSKIQYINDKELEFVYDHVDEQVDKLEEQTIAFDVVRFITNKDYYNYSIWIIAGCLILITLINLSLLPTLSLSIAPLALTSVLYLAIYLLASNVNFSGGLIADIVNPFIVVVKELSLKYFIALIVLTLIVVILYFIFKKIKIAISHKKGVATLDTVFDDYNSDEVVKEINQDNEEKEEPKEEKSDEVKEEEK